MKLFKLLLLLNQSLNFVFGLSITKWEPTMGGWYQPFYKQMQGVEIEYCLKECDQNPDCVSVSTYTCPDVRGEWCAFADTSANFMPYFRHVSVWEKVSDWQTGNARTTLQSVGNHLDVTNYNQKIKTTELGTENPIHSCEPTNYNIISEDSDQTNPATGMYSLSGPALPWFAALNVPSPSFVIDFGCVFRLVGAVIGRVLSSSMSEDRGLKSADIFGSTDLTNWNLFLSVTDLEPTDDPGQANLIFYGTQVKARYVKFVAVEGFSDGFALHNFVVNSPHYCTAIEYK